MVHSLIAGCFRKALECTPKEHQSKVEEHSSYSTTRQFVWCALNGMGGYVMRALFGIKADVCYFTVGLILYWNIQTVHKDSEL